MSFTLDVLFAVFRVQGRTPFGAPIAEKILKTVMLVSFGVRIGAVPSLQLVFHLQKHVLRLFFQKSSSKVLWNSVRPYVVR
jgi:hypothetical protein